MASAGETSIVKNLEDMTECCICCEAYTDPRMLLCIHTFCFECLRKTGLQMKKGPGQVMPCPICKEQFTIPHTGWGDLKKNFFVIKLIDLTTAAKFVEESRSIMCDNCEANNRPETNMYCIQCSKNLCLNCCNRHKKKNPSHRLRANSIESKKKSSATAFCKLHRRKPIHQYCTDCNQCICAECLKAGHQGHRCVKIDSAAKECRQEIGRSIEKVSECMLKSSAKKDDLEQDKVKFLKEMKTIEKEVNKSSQELKALVQKHTESLLKDLSSITERRLKLIGMEKGETDRHLTMSESFRQYCTEVYTNGSSSDICQLMSNVQTTSSEMQTLMKSYTERKQSDDQIFLTKTKLNPSKERAQKWNVLGEIKVLSKASFELESRVDVAAKGIHGVAKLWENIYVLCRDPNSIRVYSDQNPFDFIKKINTEYIQQPRDLAACPQSSCLYITDGYTMFTKSGNRCVWKITGGQLIATQWLSDIESPWTISVCRDGRVAMLKDGEQHARLELYQPDSTLAQSLLLPIYVREPLHAVESTAGNFIISCRYGGLWSLCEIALDGRLVAKFLPENDPERLDWPCYLAKYFDDRIIIADRDNHRVLLVNLEPTKSNQILLTRSEDSIKRPRQVLYDSDTKQLIVVHGVFRGRKMLDIYSLNERHLR